MPHELSTTSASILSVAEQAGFVTQAKRINTGVVVGTEHLLYALLRYNRHESQKKAFDEISSSCEFKSAAAWLSEALKCDVGKLLQQLQSFMSLYGKQQQQDSVATCSQGTKASAAASFLYSPSLERTLQTAVYLAGSSPSASDAGATSQERLVTPRGLLASLLLVGGDHPTAATSMLMQCVTPSVSIEERQEFLVHSSRQLMEEGMDIDRLRAASNNIRPQDFSLSWSSYPAAPANPKPLPALTAYPNRQLPASTHVLIPGKVVCGAAPSEENTLELVRTFGVNVFVCLQSSYTEYGCRDYRDTLRQAAANGDLPHTVNFLHAPIPDFGVIHPKSMLNLVTELLSCLRGTAKPTATTSRGTAVEQRMYIHCYGGHGRTGTVAANLLVAYDDAATTPEASLKRLRELHQFRVSCRRGHCALNQGELEAGEQEDQLTYLFTAMRREFAKD